MASAGVEHWLTPDGVTLRDKVLTPTPAGVGPRHKFIDPDPGRGLAPAKIFDPDPAGVLTPANIFDPDPGRGLTPSGVNPAGVRVFLGQTPGPGQLTFMIKVPAVGRSPSVI